jgi:hypothetical protein
VTFWHWFVMVPVQLGGAVLLVWVASRRVVRAWQFALVLTLWFAAVALALGWMGYFSIGG